MTVPSASPLSPAALVVGSHAAADEAPAVVAVVVAQEPGERFDELLGSLADQDYPNISVLVIDTASVPVADRLAQVLPEAFHHRSQPKLGFAAAANQAMELVSGGAFFLFCTDGVTLSPRAVSDLVEELYRSNAGIVTPKYVRAEDPRRIAAVGGGSDRFGVQVDLVEPGDFDQEQYDSVRDVFVAPAGVQLVRSDLFRALGGFDVAMGSVSEDLDLCWRAHVAGARVVAVPSAVVTRPRPPEEADANARRRALGRHRLRTLLVTSSRFSLLRVLPLALLLLLIEAGYSLVAGRRRQAADAIGAIWWNARRFGEIRERRAALHELRKISDREIHALQVGGSARLNAFFRGQFAVGDRFVSMYSSVRDSFAGDDSSGLRDATIIGGLLTTLMLFGTRDLISTGVTPVGQFLDLPGAGRLFSEWSGGWRSAGAGSPGNPATAFGVLALGKLAFFWADGLFDLLLLLGPVVLGTVGMWRLVRPLASPRASALAAVGYVANPLLVAMIAAGRWDALVVWGAAPALVGSVLRLQGTAPYGRQGGRPGPTVVDRDVEVRLLRFGFLVATVATFVPAVVLVALLLLVAVALGSVLTLRTDGLVRLGLGGVAAVVVPGALHAPWTFDILRRGSWAWLVGPPSPEAAFDSLADLLRFAPDVAGPRLLTLGLLLAAMLALLLGRGTRFDLGVNGWSVAIVFWLVAWADRRGWMPMDLPSAELLLAPAAAGLALSIGAGTRSVEIDLVGYRFGWRQIVAFGGIASMATAGLLLVQMSLGGRWDQPEQSYRSSATLLVEQYEGPARMLWVGDPSVLPVDAARTEGGISYAVVDGHAGSALGRWSPGPDGITTAIGERLDLAASGDVVRLGRLLASYGVDLVVVVPQLAPAPYVGTQHDVGGGFEDALGRQLDLARVPGTPNLRVYRNIESDGPVVAISRDALGLDGTPRSQLDTDLSGGVRIDAVPSAGGWEAGAAAPDTVADVGTLVAVTADGWDSSIEGSQVASVSDGLLYVDAPLGSELDVSYRTPLVRRLALIGQVLIVVAGIVLARSERREVES